MKKKNIAALFTFLWICFIPNTASAMHIMEGYLSPKWSILWAILAIPFVIRGMAQIQKIVHKEPKKKILLALVGAFVFVLSALKIPSLTGSSSHPTGVGLGAIMFGPSVMSFLGLLVLVFQALLLAHGGLTTLGANTFSMAIIGPMVSYGIFKLLSKGSIKRDYCVFLASALGALSTYVVTAIQLALAYPDASLGVLGSLGKFLSVFALTQIPLAIIEGIITVIVYNLIQEHIVEGSEMIENLS